MATLTYIQKPADTVVGSAKDLRSVSTSNFRRATSVEMVQLVQRNGKNLADNNKLISPDVGTVPSTNDNKQITSIQPDVVLRLSQETHKTKVFEIDLSGNAIKKVENLDGFSHLRILDLACNQIEKIENLSKNAELRELRLYANRIGCIENIEQLKKLSVLKLQQNNIEQIGEGLAQQHLLEVLRLDSNRLRFLKPAELSPLQSLRVLNISRNQLTDISSLAGLAKLETLDVSHNNIAMLPNLKKCSFLQEINASFNRLDSIAGLADNMQLVSVDVSGNGLRSLRSLGPFKKQLENMHVAENMLETLDDLLAIAPNVEILDCSKNRINNAERLMTTLQKFESLVELKYSDNPVIETLAPHDIRQLLPALEMINGVNFAKRNFAPTGDPASVRPQTPMMSARGDRNEESTVSAAIMRPKTTNTGLTLRQLDLIFGNMNGVMENLERSFAQTFDKVMTTLETEAPRCEHAETMCKSCMSASRSKQQKREVSVERGEKEPTTVAEARSSPATSSSGSSSTNAGKKAKNALTRRLEQARSFSNKMMAQTGGSNNKTNSTAVISGKPPQPRRQSSASRKK